MRQVIIYPGEDGYWVAECPSLPGCISQGKTREEAIVNIREAIRGYIAALLVRPYVMLPELEAAYKQMAQDEEREAEALEWAERFKAHVPPRQRSTFIAEVLEEQLAIEEQSQALAESAGSWSDEHHPDMTTGEDIDSWLAALRGRWQRQEDE